MLSYEQHVDHEANDADHEEEGSPCLAVCR